MSALIQLVAQVNAAHIILREQERLVGSTSYVQRKLLIGYNRASLILSVLEEAEIISSPDQAGERHWQMDVGSAMRRLNGASA